MREYHKIKDLPEEERKEWRRKQVREALRRFREKKKWDRIAQEEKKKKENKA